MFVEQKYLFFAGFLIVWWITCDHFHCSPPALFQFPKTDERIQSAGYKAETHYIITTDGYNLTTFRIVHSVDTRRRIPVILQHGLLCSSDCWVISKHSKALGFVLAEEGYDVWLTNSRGNSYSRGHVNYTIKDDAFWDFSFHEMGMYDLPATIDYILNLTGEDSLFYVGHSQGTATFFVMTSTRPEYNKKVKAMFALAPIAILDNTKGIARALGRISPFLTKAANLFNVKHVLDPSVILAITARTFCPLYIEKCDDIVSYIVGYGSNHFNKDLIPYLADTCPAGASMKQMVHFFQLVRNDGKFSWFDYGNKNQLLYNSTDPPEYNLSAISSPIFLYYGPNDYISSISDVKRLYSKLHTVVELKEVATFNHLDFMWAKDGKDILYDHIIQHLKKF